MCSVLEYRKALAFIAFSIDNSDIKFKIICDIGTLPSAPSVNYLTIVMICQEIIISSPQNLHILVFSSFRT